MMSNLVLLYATENRPCLPTQSMYLSSLKLKLLKQEECKYKKLHNFLLFFQFSRQHLFSFLYNSRGQDLKGTHAVCFSISL